VLLSEISGLLLEKNLELGQVKNQIKGIQKHIQAFVSKKQKFVVGQTEAEAHLQTLQKSPVVVLSEFRFVKDMLKTFVLHIAKTELEIKEAHYTLEMLQSKEKILKSEIETLSKSEERALNNILEFPIQHDTRPSEEKD